MTFEMTFQYVSRELEAIQQALHDRTVFTQSGEFAVIENILPEPARMRLVELRLALDRELLLREHGPQ